MLRVRNLIEFAQRYDVAGFTQSVGPIGLMQQPPPQARADLVRKQKPKHTVPLPTLNANTLPMLGDFEQLLVATLPPAKADGSVDLTIGRTADNTLVVEDPAVSARHAAIRWDGKKGILVDLGSANGTFVNRKRMPTAQQVLGNGDELAFGLSTFVYLLAADFHARLRASSKR